MSYSPDIEECPPLNPDDKEILFDLLYPIFQEAVDQNKNLTRDALRERLARYFFPWIHVREVLKELEEKDYVALLTTRGGGVYGAGSRFNLWQEEMKPVEAGAAPPAGRAAEPLQLEPAQISALVALFKALASSSPPAGVIDRVRLAATESADESDFLKRLAVY